MSDTREGNLNLLQLQKITEIGVHAVLISNISSERLNLYLFCFIKRFLLVKQGARRFGLSLSMKL